MHVLEYALDSCIHILILHVHTHIQIIRVPAKAFFFNFCLRLILLSERSVTVARSTGLSKLFRRICNLKFFLKLLAYKYTYIRIHNNIPTDTMTNPLTPTAAHAPTGGSKYMHNVYTCNTHRSCSANLL